MLTLFVLCSRVHNFVFLFLFNVKLIEMKIIQFALQPIQVIGLYSHPEHFHIFIVFGTMENASQWKACSMVYEK